MKLFQIRVTLEATEEKILYSSSNENKIANIKLSSLP